MRGKHRIHLFASHLHKWLALFIGAQLLIWFASGALMSLLPIAKVRGEHLVSRNTVAPIPTGLHLVPPEKLLAQVGVPVEALTWRILDNKPVAEVATARGVRLYDATNGNALPPIDAAAATRIAERAWKSDQKPGSTVTRITEESPEYRGTVPSWRIAFADPDGTSVFVAADTGRIAAVRTGTWRLYDFFWSLHIMDWKNHEDFNTPWLVAFAIGGLLFGLAGTMLLFMRWPIRRKRAAKALGPSKL
ncbi:PepSY domain-containing protein [Novosphingobium aquiterrae]|uniref:PepSY domain-containing protein n=1 Tax=Novosphingobium aquiterrae TaxID=624388 RepID=A0ABV6PI65_9SPHN